MADDIIVIHPTLKRRVSASGKARFTMEVKSEALIVSLDTKLLEQGVAQAIADELRTRVTSITQDAAPATLKARAVAARAVAGHADRRAVNNTAFAKKERAEGRGHLLDGDGSWAMKRYSGGKLGFMPPNQSRRAFNDSGRFAKSIVAGAASGGRWIVNWAANRLDPATGNVERIWNRLVSLVPAFADVSQLYSSPKFVEALGRGIEAMGSKSPMSSDEITLMRAKQIAEAKTKQLAVVIARVVLAAI